ncbi:hypothetical protein OF83DRAFT_1176840 [Amylostereum chailletii]|nr:hypothetical protein OF83DRAFT_1176840 [Amylostereum chailletii]
MRSTGSNPTGNWLRRSEERSVGVNGLGKKASINTPLDKPSALVEEFFKKPATLIPALGVAFEVWFKKACLQPGPVYILQGRVAVEHAIKKGKPIKEMLDNVTSILVVKLLKRSYGGGEGKIAVIDLLGATYLPPPRARQAAQCKSREKATIHAQFTVTSAVPNVGSSCMPSSSCSPSPSNDNFYSAPRDLARVL